LDLWFQYLLMDLYNQLDLSNLSNLSILYHPMDQMDPCNLLNQYRQYLLLDLFLMDPLHLFHLLDL
jgi:hypothetical protein